MTWKGWLAVGVVGLLALSFVFGSTELSKEREAVARLKWENEKLQEERDAIQARQDTLKQKLQRHEDANKRLSAALDSAHARIVYVDRYVAELPASELQRRLTDELRRHLGASE